MTELFLLLSIILLGLGLSMIYVPLGFIVPALLVMAMCILNFINAKK